MLKNYVGRPAKLDPLSRIITWGFAALARVVFTLAMLIVAAVAQEQTITLRLNNQDLQHLGACVQELPKRVADPFLAKLQQQIAEQMKLAEKPKEN